MKKIFLIWLFLPLSLFACGPTMEMLWIFLAYIVGSITLFIWSFFRFKKSKRKWYLLGFVPFLYLLLQIAYIYVAIETDWLDNKSHKKHEFHPWRVEVEEGVK